MFLSGAGTWITPPSAGLSAGIILDFHINAAANIQGSKIQDASIPMSKFQSFFVTGSQISAQTITDNNIATNANIQGSKIADSSITMN